MNRKLKIAIPDNIDKLSIIIATLSHYNVDYFLVDKQDDVSDFDGLLLPGGVDIDPSRFHEQNYGSKGINKELDERQISVLDKFVKMKKPVLGICRGLQLINVYFEGSLIQDLENSIDHVKINGNDNINEIVTEKGSILNKLYGDKFKVNSSHHQAIGKLGKELIVTSRCIDGVIESIEHTSLPILAVQFHPERMCYNFYRDDMVDGKKIIEYFLDKCYEI